jgi:hypothetical protein
MPIDDAQKEVLRKRLELARASKVAKKQKINDVVQAPKAEVVEEEPEPKQVQEEKESVITKVIEKAPQPLVELPKKVKAKEDTEGAFSKKDRYAKLVFYKDPSQKTIKKMTSILASSDDDEPAEKAPAKQVNIAPPTPQVKPQPDPRLLRQQQISNLSKRFFDC